MEFLRKLFKDDDYIVGLSGFKEELGGIKKIAKSPKTQCYNIFTPPKNLVFYTNTKDNFLLS